MSDGVSGGGSAEGGFSPRTVLAMLLVGVIAFVGLLYLIGAGDGVGDANDGNAHVASNGVTGYSALSKLLSSTGTQVDQLRGQPDEYLPGLLVLTPPPYADGDEIAKIIQNRRYSGPTLLILPKWGSFPLYPTKKVPNPPEGWVRLTFADAPGWIDKLTEEVGMMAVEVDIPKTTKGDPYNGAKARTVRQYFASTNMVPALEDEAGRLIVSYSADDGYYPSLNALAGVDAELGGDNDSIFPVIVVAEPDLLNNLGMRDEASARKALSIIEAARGDEYENPVTFDLTLNGYGGSQNLLTLAFKPPFLAATLCLLMAALAVGWRSFNRFGPALVRERMIALGKTALVDNSAGFIRRTGRVHLIARPYVDLVRARLARVLGLPRNDDPAMLDAAIDEVAARRGVDGAQFSNLAAALSGARKPHDITRRAAALAEYERKLTP